MSLAKRVLIVLYGAAIAVLDGRLELERVYDSSGDWNYVDAKDESRFASLLVVEIFYG